MKSTYTTVILVSPVLSVPTELEKEVIADGVGWGSFELARIACPVIVIHGGSDTVVPVEHAHHTAAIVPGAKLRVFEELGHFSIISQVVPAVAGLLAR